jgi:glycine/D-amino acid oxidase-like deaminating enzyme
MDEITVVGGGIAGLCAAITAAEEGAGVRLLEARAELGGRARSTDGPYRANLGPHVLYKDGAPWAWLSERSLLPPTNGIPLGSMKFHHQGSLRRTPPLASVPAVLKLRGRKAPQDISFREWATRHAGAEAAELLSMGAGVYTFHHDPGELSAAFIWQRTVRTLLTPPPAVRYVVGGWNAYVDVLEGRARELGVAIETQARAESLPPGVVIVATELADAARLLDDDGLRWPSGHAVCVDLGVRRRRGDPFVVSDLDAAGWIERFSAADHTLAPDGEDLIQGQMPIAPGEDPEQAGARLDRLLDLSHQDLQGRITWRRRQVMDARTGALDRPGTSWRDRPAVDRGHGVYLAGDCVAAPGLLSEVAWASGVEAGRSAAALVRGAGARLRRVA